MSKKNFKILYDKENKVLSVNMKAGKSVDSEMNDSVVIDYDKKGEIVRVNFYDLDFNAFKENKRELKNFSFAFHAPLSVQ